MEAPSRSTAPVTGRLAGRSPPLGRSRGQRASGAATDQTVRTVAGKEARGTYSDDAQPGTQEETKWLLPINFSG